MWILQGYWLVLRVVLCINNSTSNAKSKLHQKIKKKNAPFFFSQEASGQYFRVSA